MKDKIAIAIVLIILAVCASVFIVSLKIELKTEQPNTELNIEEPLTEPEIIKPTPSPSLNIVQEIDKANYCEVDSDCVNAGRTCNPPRCYNYVNKNEVDRIKGSIRPNQPYCLFQCAACNPVCENHKCEAVCK
jgi:hypothetical protein